MTRVEPIARDDLPHLEAGFQLVEAAMGFVPTSMRTMAHVPGLTEAFGQLGRTVLGNPLLEPELKTMISHVVSYAAGCRYCQAHTATTATHQGSDQEKISALWAFETDERFSDAERAALRLAFRAGQVPNATSEEDFAECRKYYTEEQIASIVAVIAFFGYLNRWNDTMATTLEDAPLSVAADLLADNGWVPDKHAARFAR